MVAFAGATPSAEAAFTTQPCMGTQGDGRGASFQTKAQGAFRLGFQTRCRDAVGSAPNISYDGAGSGPGRSALGANSGGTRDLTIRFAGTDEPPNATDQMNIERGRVEAGDEGDAHLIPVAVGSVAIIVNFPNACNVNDLPAGNKAPGTTSSNTRVQFTASQFEEVFAAAKSGSTTAPDNDTFGEVFGQGAGAPASFAPGTACGDTKVVRVVRSGNSGTTFTLKDFLNVINPGRGWPGLGGRSDSPVFPNEIARETTSGTPPMTTTDPNGNILKRTPGSGVASGVAATDGSIGYVVLGEARDAGFTNSSTTDDTYFIPVQKTSGEFNEPDVAPNGANCAGVVFRNVPATTLDDFSQVSGVNSDNPNAARVDDYGICTLTYDLAFDDNATVYGNTVAEEQKARTVKDYLTYIVDPNGGQQVLFSNDYAPLPVDVRNKAVAGVNAIGFNKAGDAGGGGGGGGGTTPPAPTDTDGDGVADTSDNCDTQAGPASNGGCPVVVPPPPPTDTDGDGVADSTDRCDNTRGPASNQGCPVNAFSFVGKVTLIGSRVRVRVRVPGAGRVVGSTAGNATGTKTVGAKKAGTVTLLLKLSPGAKRQLQRKRKLVVRVRVTFRPTGGLTRSRNVRVTLRLPRR